MLYTTPYTVGVQKNVVKIILKNNYRTAKAFSGSPKIVGNGQVTVANEDE